MVISKKNLTIVSHLTKPETSLVIWLNVVTLLLEVSMPLINYIVSDGLVNAMPIMQKMLLQVTTLD